MNLVPTAIEQAEPMFTREIFRAYGYREFGSTRNSITEGRPRGESARW